MAKSVFGMNVSLDGYVDHQAFSPGPALFRHFIDETRRSAGSLYGRVMYGVMRYWDGDDWDQGDTAQRQDLSDFAMAWRREPKWVFSHKLTEVGPNATLVRDDLEATARDLKARLDGEIGVSGTKLAHSLGQLGLIDEYVMYLHPVVLGGGKPFFAGPRPPLRFAGSRQMDENVVRLSYVPG